MRIFSIVLIALFGYSCCETHNETTYKYKGSVITRIDKCGETSFYYQTDGKRAKGRIWIKYSGINDGFSGFLRFDDSGNVAILSGDGYFQMENVDVSKFTYQRVYSYQIPDLGNGVYYIALSKRYELEKNKGVQSGIKAEYHN